VSLNAAVALRESQRCLRLCDARMGFAYPTKWRILNPENRGALLYANSMPVFASIMSFLYSLGRPFEVQDGIQAAKTARGKDKTLKPVIITPEGMLVSSVNGGCLRAIACGAMGGFVPAVPRQPISLAEQNQIVHLLQPTLEVLRLPAGLP